MKVVASLALLIVAVTACGSHSNAGGAPASTASEASTWTTQEAGRQYLALVRQTNADYLRLGTLTQNGASVRQIKRVCQALADDDSRMASAAQEGQWPVQVNELMQRWSTAVSRQGTDFQQCARHPVVKAEGGSAEPFCDGLPTGSVDAGASGAGIE